MDVLVYALQEHLYGKGENLASHDEGLEETMRDT